MAKLLSINNYHYRRGGSDVVYLDHAALMEELGWKNAFFSMSHPKNVDTPWSQYFVDEIEFGNAYSAKEKLTMAAKVVYSFEAKRKLRNLLSVFPADVAHLHCIYHHLSPSIIHELVRAKVPVVLTAHDLKIACPAYKMLNSAGICERCKGGNVMNLVMNRCIKDSTTASALVAVESVVHRLLNTYKKNVDKVVVPSKFFTEKFVEWGWPREKFLYIPNYVDASRFEPAFEPGSYFLYFGRLAPEKGVATLMRAARNAGVKLKIAGTGPEENSLHLLQGELQGEIEFLGYQSGAALHSLIKNAKAVVLPSEWYENAPMSVLESFAFGKPVIGANIGGIPEMIESGNTGYLFESGSHLALAEVLRKFDRMGLAEIAALGRSARLLVEERFNRKGYVAATTSMYADLGVAA